MSDEIQVWITKYAFGKGVIKTIATANQYYRNAVKVQEGGFTHWFHGEGVQWHRTRESAEARVAVMVGARRASLQRALARLNKPIGVPE